MTDFQHIIDQLRSHRAEVMAKVEALDKAIAALTRAAGGDSPDTPTTDTRRRAPRGHGVKQQVIDFVSASGRDWDAHELAQEFARQGKEFGVEDTLNAIRSALSRGTKAGQLIRTEPGRYISVGAAHSRNGEVASDFPEGLEEPASAPTG